MAGSLTTKYIRFRFDNPNQAMSLGYLAEVEFYGHALNSVPTATSTPFPRPTATNTPIPTDTPVVTNTPTPTQTPSALDGELIAAIGGGGSSSGNWSGYARDGSVRTTWQTITTPTPTRAQVYVDLGKVGTITGAEFTFRRKSGARSYQIRVSSDKVSWVTVARFTYAEPLVWQRARFWRVAGMFNFCSQTRPGRQHWDDLARSRFTALPRVLRRPSNPGARPPRLPLWLRRLIPRRQWSPPRLRRCHRQRIRLPTSPRPQTGHMQHR